MSTEISHIKTNLNNLPSSNTTPVSSKQTKDYLEFIKAVDAQDIKAIKETANINFLNTPELFIENIDRHPICYLDKATVNARKPYTGEVGVFPIPEDKYYWGPSVKYPLFRAINTGNTEIVECLLKLGSDPNLINPLDLGYCLFHFDYSLSFFSKKPFSEETQRKILSLLIEAGYDPTKLHTVQSIHPDAPKFPSSLCDFIQSTADLSFEIPFKKIKDNLLKFINEAAASSKILQDKIKGQTKGGSAGSPATAAAGTSSTLLMAFNPANPVTLASDNAIINSSATPTGNTMQSITPSKNK